MRQTYAGLGGLLLGLGLTRIPAYDGAEMLAVLSGVGVGLTAVSLVCE